MMLTTIGANTGSVRLPTRMRGACACADVDRAATTKPMPPAMTLRRDVCIMTVPHLKTRELGEKYSPRLREADRGTRLPAGAVHSNRLSLACKQNARTTTRDKRGMAWTCNSKEK